MRVIAHRGNLTGRPDHVWLENDPNYVDRALAAGFDAEVDVWCVKGHWWLGHDNPEYEIERDWLLDQGRRLWVHCKNAAALEGCAPYREAPLLNFFWHDRDDYTLTSHGYIWSLPGKGITDRSIVVDAGAQFGYDKGVLPYGICTDYPIKISSLLAST